MQLTSTAPRRVAAAALCCGVLLGWLACGGGGSGCDGTGPCPPPGDTGELQVVVTTAGPDTDPNGYTVRIGGVADSTVQPNDTLSITGLAPGAHQVQLTDLTTDCAVSGTNPKSVTILQKIGIRQPPPSVAIFQVTCGVGTGSVLVKTSTTGDPPDPDGYQLLLDGVDQGNIRVQDAVTLTGVTTSQAHDIALGGVDANCQLQGDNPRAFQVTPGTQVEVEFIVTCQAPAVEVGALQVTVTTAGEDPDPDGYGLSLDGASAQPVGINATVTISGLSAGNHQLRFTRVADNCQVQGGATVSVTIIANDTVEVSQTVACTARPGAIEVTTTTVGTAAGDYTVTLDGGGGQPIGPNDSHTFQGVAAGVVHTVAIEILTPACVPAEGAAQTVMVEGGQTAHVSFTVSCSTTNTPPTANDDPGYQVPAGGTLIRDTANGVLKNDSDPDGDSLKVLNPDFVAWPQNAADFKLFPNGGFRYTPLAGFTGPDQFTYQALDARGLTSNSATVTITVGAGNGAPIAVNDAYSIPVNGAITTDRTTGVLVNDIDPDGDSLEVVNFELVTAPASAAFFQMFRRGGFKYTPVSGFTGPAQFTYRAHDPDGAESNEATVTITVNP